MAAHAPGIAILGASGLIGHAMATHLAREGFRVVALARRFTPAQRAVPGILTVESPLVGLDSAALAALLSRHGCDIVVNCVGVLQDSARRGSATDAHAGFAARLVEALASAPQPRLLVHLSVPGDEKDDRTAFSTTKREAERIIAGSGVPHVILRPGFVVAPAAYGGSALIRALAVMPFKLPEREGARHFAATDVLDIARTAVFLARRWREGKRRWHASWDVMERGPSTAEGVVEAFRRHLGGPAPLFRLPSWLMALGASAGDIVSHLGWSPPVRSTALAEMRRGVEGDPGPWTAATGIEPASLADTLARLPATVQEKWFARLYFAKPLVLGVLALFWIATGLVALTVAFDAAAAILAAHGFPLQMAKAVTVATSLADIAIGAAIAWRATCRAGLIAGICLSLLYIAGSVVLSPAMWADPLGAMVKTVPAVVLMLVALAIMDER